MLIKNRETLSQIIPRDDLLPVLEKNKEVLASVFLRNKDVFMQFKKCKELCHIINVIRKLATKLHKPMKKSPWLQLEELSYSEREKLFKNASIFKLAQMYNALNNPTGYYIIICQLFIDYCSNSFYRTIRRRTSCLHKSCNIFKKGAHIRRTKKNVNGIILLLVLV